MKSIPECLVVVFFSVTFSSFAHDIWVTGKQTGEIFNAEIGYGHNFPERGVIPGRRDFFVVPQLTDGSHRTLIKTISEDYLYTTEKKFDEGGYILTTQMKPMFWSRTSEGWKPVDKRQHTTVHYCEFVTKYAKSLITVGTSGSHAVHRVPAGQELEIVPVSDLIHISPDSVKFKLIYKGEPLPNALLELDSAEYLSRKHQAEHQDNNHKNHAHKPEVSAESDKSGVITLASLHKGKWLAKVKHKQTFGDQKLCDEIVVVATLSFWRESF